jgi:hypothetical protein
MGYSDPEYNVSIEVPVGFSVNVGTMTATASAHVVTNTAVTTLPKFKRRTKVNSIRVQIITAPAAGANGTTLNFLSGTNVFASAVVGTNTAGAAVDATMTAANATFAADGQPTVNAVSTATASETKAQGTYNIWFEVQELPA